MAPVAAAAADEVLLAALVASHLSTHGLRQPRCKLEEVLRVVQVAAQELAQRHFMLAPGLGMVEAVAEMQALEATEFVAAAVVDLARVTSSVVALAALALWWFER
jgi:hypothetical protein